MAYSWKSKASVHGGDDTGVEVVLDDAGWRVHARVISHRGMPVIASLTVEPRRPDRIPVGGVTARLLRSVPIMRFYEALTASGPPPGLAGDALIAARVAHAKGRGPKPRAAPVGARQLAEMSGLTELDDFDRVRRPGRRGRDDATYAVWAARYVKTCAAGSRRPIADLAKEHGETTRSVRDRVQRARERGLLEGGIQGRPGGRLTKKAERILRGER